ncbi:sporulation protein [Bacillus sp. DNRA2]|uniref:GerMN domain-containing protein n=1 Tax=Bacillus sp. DNRA2 TaxID=2723053 RepID=UPI00145DC6E7|nr:GerMN domain-containing protein [Bacillus sp. DNRA2]NMD70682.1 sporulation protein [Bacillus sp. DNRA2]
MSLNKRTLFFSTVILLATTLTGCGLLGGEEKKQIDPPETVTYEDSGKAVKKESASVEKNDKDKKEAAEKTVMTELYLIDKDGYVVPQTMALEQKEGIAKQALEYLVVNGPVSEMLPNGFQAVIPADTQVSVDIKDKVAVVDFSKEFANYKKEQEQQILEAVTWTLTQFDSVDSVKLQMNGKVLKEMPVNGTPISAKQSRANGINIDAEDVVDISNTKAVTVYFVGGETGNYYYVPVTRRVDNKVKNNIEAAVNELVKGPSYTTDLQSEFAAGVELLDKPKIENGKVTLNFNEAIFGGFKEKIISNHLLNSLVLSLTEQKGIESVSILVKGKAELVTEEGEKLSAPVTRPENVNTGSY